MREFTIYSLNCLRSPQGCLNVRLALIQGGDQGTVISFNFPRDIHGCS